MKEHLNTSGKILIIEEKPCKLLTSLTPSTYSLTNAQKSEDVFSILGSKKIELVIIDASENQAKYFQLLTEIRDSFDSQQLPVLVILSLDNKLSVKTALEAGANDYLCASQINDHIEQRIYWLIKQSEKHFAQTSKLKKKASLQSDFKQIESALLQTSFYDLSIFGNPLNQTLKLTLSIILSAPLLPEDPAGAIFLADPEENELHLACQLGLPDDLTKKCAIVKKGECLCGMVLKDKMLSHYEYDNVQHTIKSEESNPHGHYIIPIISDKNSILGVLNIYLDHNKKKPKELGLFLSDVALILAMIISRKNYESRLLASQNRFRSISNSSNDGIIATDQLGRITFANPATNRIFNYNENELVGKMVTTIIPERFQQAHRDGMQRAVVLGKTSLIGKTIELFGLRKDGDEIPVEISIAMWHAEDKVAFSAFIRDVSELKKLNSELLNAKIEVEEFNEKLAQANNTLIEERNIIENIVLKIQHSPLFDQTNLRIIERPLEKNSGDLICAAKRNDGARRVLLGDFAGHGLTAAIACPLISEIFYANGLNVPFEKMFADLNTRLLKALNEDMFMACSCIELNSDKNLVTLFNAGMVDIFILRQGNIIHQEPSGFVPRGLIDVPDKEKITFPVQKGDRIILCTDGFEEAVNPSGKMFGEIRFKRILEDTIKKNRPLEYIFDQINNYRQGGKQEDDMTLVEFTC
ncbi:MAG: SpoIIE family protein phosphatase [Magnetococcales bacterium]|nr:SpoIIE family protein phosphatase [Magnetococcales bacterium]